MKLTLYLKNLVPAVTLTRVDFLGSQRQEDLRHGRLDMVHSLMRQEAKLDDNLTFQLELLPADVSEMAVKLLKNTEASASWYLNHGTRYLLGCIISFPAVAGYGGSHVVETNVPRYDELATIVFKRSPLCFDSDGRLLARTWTICHTAKVGKIWKNSVSVSERDPDPVQPAG